MERTDEPSNVVCDRPGKQHQHPTVYVSPTSIDLDQNSMRLLTADEIVMYSDCLAWQKLVSVRLSQHEPILRQRRKHLHRHLLDHLVVH